MHVVLINVLRIFSYPKFWCLTFSTTKIEEVRFFLAKFGSQINGIGFSEAVCKISAYLDCICLGYSYFQRARVAQLVLLVASDVRMFRVA